MPSLAEVPAPGLHGSAANLFGGSFAGNLLSAVVFGVLTVQLWRYFESFPRDPWSIKLTLVFLWCVEGFQVACVSNSLWHFFVASYFNPLALEKSTWEFAFYQLSSVTQSATVQTFFAYRVYSLSDSIWLGLLLELFAALQFGFGLYVAVEANISLSFASVVMNDTWAVNTWLGIQAGTDLLICTVMVLLLHRRRTGFKTTDSALNFMIIWTLNTGVMTALFSFVILGMFAEYGFHFVVLLLGLPLGGFYSFTMLTNLHTRTQFANKMFAARTNGITIPLTTMGTMHSHPFTEYTDGSTSSERRTAPNPNSRPSDVGNGSTEGTSSRVRPRSPVEPTIIIGTLKEDISRNDAAPLDSPVDSDRFKINAASSESIVFRRNQTPT